MSGVRLSEFVLLAGASALALSAPARAEGVDENAESAEVSQSGGQSGTATQVAAADDDIVVRATRPAYRGDFDPLEIPQNEQIIGPQQLRDTNVLDLVSALDLSASISRQNNFGGLWNSFAVRGFVGDENLPSNFLVNGFNAGRGFSGPRDIAGVEAVEVLKGPRAAVFGRGEPGGTVNLVTKRPRFETAGEVHLQAGSFDFYRGDVDVQGTLGDRVGVRFVAFFEDSGSFRDTIETQRYGVMPSVAIMLTEDTTLVYEIEYTRQEIPFDRGVLAIDGELGQIPRSRFLGEPGDGPLVGEVFGHQVELQHNFSDSWSLLAGFNYRDSSLEGFSTEPELAAGRQLLFVDGRTLTRQRRFRDYDAQYFVARAELAGNYTTGDIEHRLLFGLDTDRFENDQVFLRARAPTLGSNPTLEQLQAIDVFEPVYGQFPLPATGPLTDRVEVQKSTGLYFQYQMSFGERLDVRVGGRYDDFSLRLNNRASGATSELDQTRFSPQVGAVYHVVPQISLYATYGQNFRPLSGADFAGNTFDPNQSESIEAGVKFDSRSGRLSATASVFSIQQSNILVADMANPGFSAAAGEASSKGFEFDLQGEILPSLDLWVSYAYVDAQVDNDVLDFNFGSPILAGDRLLNIPDHTLNVQLAYQAQIAGRDARFGGGVLHVGDRLGEVATNFELPAYTLARVFAETELVSNISLRFDIDNLFNTTWYSNSFSQLWIQPGLPRTGRVSARFAF